MLSKHFMKTKELPHQEGKVLLLFSLPTTVWVWVFVIPWTVACQASLSLTISWSLSGFMFIALVMLSSHLVFWCPLLLLPSILSRLGTFLMSHLFTSDDQNTRTSASASVLPVNIQGWPPLRLIGLITPCCPWDFQESSPAVRRHQLFGILYSLESSPHNCMWPLAWLYHSLDCTE